MCYIHGRRRGLQPSVRGLPAHSESMYRSVSDNFSISDQVFDWKPRLYFGLHNGSVEPSAILHNVTRDKRSDGTICGLLRYTWNGICHKRIYLVWGRSQGLEKRFERYGDTIYFDEK